ncbi:aminodeoxychorismate lyase [Hahella sp. CCB-MM4]|uniref:aminodeoxychorismate lyase n=1 Tax=Hahella sp. (strain CCB-MM4) TaxID=1926491 RepID=UPI000B9BE2AE|nr:aminodeoxychorismate lyase [Hahella sp. CCB-MM4]OZG71297.1 aminodeoxychorismate lyase [Hahella sp. CCB-MM4]
MYMVNGVLTDVFPVSDRGLQYGDGVFETVLMHEGKPVLWREHLERLERGCRTLRIPYAVNDAGLSASIKEVYDRYHRVGAPSVARCVIKIMITRGGGGRGYRPSQNSHPSEIISIHPLPEIPLEIYQSGIAVRSLKASVSQNPTLAGLKHLNRLDQVMASMELGEDEFEGMMHLPNGDLIEGTKSNVLAKINDRWVTPEISGAGVKGVLRQYLLARSINWGLPVEETRLGQAELADLQAMAIMNSVFGIIPVNRFNETELDVHSVLQEVQASVHKEIPFF